MLFKEVFFTLQKIYQAQTSYKKILIDGNELSN